MTTYGMMIDVERCTGCYNCFLSCKDEYCGNDYPSYSVSQPEFGQFWMDIKEIERGSYPKMKVDYTPIPCMQCEAAPCAKAATGGAVYRREDGIVMIDPEKAKGQKDIVNACPYRVIYWNEAQQVPQKCTFCAHLLDKGWKLPRCVEACPTDALIFGDLDDPNSAVSKAKASGEFQPIYPGYQGAPKVLYKDLPKRFVAGEVVLTDKQDECAVGVTVTLKGDGNTVTTQTDIYGDFEFDGLKQDTDYSVVIDYAGYGKLETSVRTKIDVNLGEVGLEPRS